MKETVIKNTISAGNRPTRSIYIPGKILQDMGIDSESPEVVMEYDYNTKVLTIKKAGKE